MNNPFRSQYYSQRFLQLCFIVFWGLALSGCGFLSELTGPASSSAAQGSTSAAAEQPKPSQLTVEQVPTTSDLELIWAVPNDPVDRFILKYGFAMENLDKEVSIAAVELSSIDTPEHGKAFRYIISNLPKDKTIYLTLTSARGEELSQPSEVFEVRPAME